MLTMMQMYTLPEVIDKLTMNLVKEEHMKRLEAVTVERQLTKGERCPECDYDGGKLGHTKQINPNNPNDLICGNCSRAFLTLKEKN